MTRMLSVGACVRLERGLRQGRLIGRGVAWATLVLASVAGVLLAVLPASGAWAGMTMSATPNPVVVGGGYTVRAEIDYSIWNTGDVLQIFNDQGQLVCGGTSNSECVTQPQVVPWSENVSLTPRTFKGRVISQTNAGAPVGAGDAHVVVSAVARDFGMTLTSTPQPVTVGSGYYMTATTAVNLSNTGLALQIVDEDNGTVVASCGNGSVCNYQAAAVPWTQQPNPQDRHYSARIVDSTHNDAVMQQGPSRTIDVIARQMNLTMTATVAQPVPISELYAVKAEVDLGLDNTGLQIEMFDVDANYQLNGGPCGNGSQCQSSTMRMWGGKRHFLARVVHASSGTVVAASALTVVGAPAPAVPDLFGCGCHAGAPEAIAPEAADPVILATGNLAEKATDVVAGGRGLGLGVTRTYNSLAAVDATEPGPLGYGWTSSWREHLSVAIETVWPEKVPGRRIDYRIVTVHNADGSTTPFYEVGGRDLNQPSTFVGPAWNRSTFVENQDGTYSYTLIDQTAFKFSATGRLLSATDSNGNQTTLQYANGNLATVTGANGRVLSFDYNPDGTVHQVTDSLEHSVVYGYSSGGDLTSVTDLNGETTTYGYTGHRLTSMTDPRGHTVSNTYDTQNRVTAQQDRAGHTSTFAYTTGATTFTDANGDVTRVTFEQRLPTQITSGYGTADSATQNITYDNMYRPYVISDGAGRSVTLDRNSAGDVTRVRDGLYHDTDFTWDSKHRMTTMTLPSGKATAFTYDTRGNLTKTARTRTETSQTLEWTNTYNSTGELTSATDPLDHTWSYAYNANGDLTTVTSPLGRSASYGYDAAGRRTSSVSPRGNQSGATAADFTTTIDLDAAGLVERVTDPRGNHTDYGYDDNGNVTDVTDADGRHTRTVYDNEDRPTAVTAGYGTSEATTAHSTYDDAGRVVSQIDGLGEATLYTYNRRSEIKTVTDPLNRTTQYTYDRAGNLTGVTDAAGRTQTLTYDAANRLTGTSFSTGNPGSISYGYNSDDQLLTATRGTATSTLSYDSLGRLASSTNPVGQVTGYHYDNASRLTALDYPDLLLPRDMSTSDPQDTADAGTVDYGYDADGRMTSVTDWLDTETSFDYNADGQLTSTSRPGVDATTYAYNRSGALTTIAQPGIDAGDATLTTNYTRTGTDRLAGTGADSNAIDALGRLTEHGAVEYGYDDGDNLTQTIAADGATEITQAFDDAHQLTTATPAGGTTTHYAYNALGNRTSETLGSASTPAVTYGYDQANRLTSYRASIAPTPRGRRSRPPTPTTRSASARPSKTATSCATRPTTSLPACR